MVYFQAPIVALLTPFDVNGEIDWRVFKTYLSALFSWGVRTVIVNGTTGEFPSLSYAERQRAVEFVRRNFAGTIINNVSATCVADVRDLIAGTRGCADAALLLPPYYYAGCRDEGLSRFFIDALTGTSIPAMLYHFPQHTGNCLGTDVVATLLDHGLPIAGIKDSSGDMDNAVRYRSHFPELAIFLGNDSKILEALRKGLSGSVSGGANPVPELLLAMQKNFRLAGAQVQSMQQCLDVWNRFREASGYFEIPVVKAAMGARIADFPIHVRAPFISVPEEAIGRIRNIVVQCLNYCRAHGLLDGQP